MPLSSLDLASPSQVIAAFEAGASANLSAQCRRGSIDHITGPGQLIATGDLHDHPVNFRAIVRLAGMEGQPDSGTAGPHATFHELIYSDKLIDGMDMSYRVLCRVAALKAAFPQRVHALLANHEIAQVHGQGVSKNGVNCVKAFNAGVEYVFGSEAARVDEAIRGFIASMPLALRCTPSAGGRDVLCAHSLPDSDALDRFDPSVLERALTDGDFTPPPRQRPPDGLGPRPERSGTANPRRPLGRRPVLAGPRERSRRRCPAWHAGADPQQRPRQRRLLPGWLAARVITERCARADRAAGHSLG